MCVCKEAELRKITSKITSKIAQNRSTITYNNAICLFLTFCVFFLLHTIHTERVGHTWDVGFGNKSNSDNRSIRNARLLCGFLATISVDQTQKIFPLT